PSWCPSNRIVLSRVSRAIARQGCWQVWRASNAMISSDKAFPDLRKDSDVVNAKSGRTAATSVKRKIWIDLDNSPHVPFFAPIIEELERHGYSVLLTARDC